MKILVVEDDPDSMQRLLNAVMSDRDSNEIEVTLTNRLVTADILIGTNSFDLIFIDHDLPDGIAPNYLEKWKKQGLLSNTHVVAISSDDECNLKMLDCGAHESISKVSGFEKYVRETIEEVANEK